MFTEVMGTRKRLGDDVNKLYAARAQGNIQKLLDAEETIHRKLHNEARVAREQYPNGSQVWDLFKLHEYLVEHKQPAIDIFIDNWYNAPKRRLPRQTTPRHGNRNERDDDVFASGILKCLCDHRVTCHSLLKRTNNGFLSHCLVFSQTGLQPRQAQACLTSILTHAMVTDDVLRANSFDVAGIRSIVYRHVEVVEVLMSCWDVAQSFRFVVPLLVHFARHPSVATATTSGVNATATCATSTCATSMSTCKSKSNSKMVSLDTMSAPNQKLKERLVSNPQLVDWLLQFLTWERHFKQLVHDALEIIRFLLQEPHSVLQQPHAQVVFQALHQCAAIYGAQKDKVIERTCHDLIHMYQPQRKLLASPSTKNHAAAPDASETISLVSLIQQFADHRDLGSRRLAAKKLQTMFAISSQLVSVIGQDFVRFRGLEALISFARASRSETDQHLVEQMLVVLASKPAIALAMMQQEPFLKDLMDLTKHESACSMYRWVWSCLHCLSRHANEDLQRALVDSEVLQVLMKWSQVRVNQDFGFWHNCCGILRNLCHHGDAARRVLLADKGGILLCFQILENQDPRIHVEGLHVLSKLTRDHEPGQKLVCERFQKVKSFTHSADHHVAALAGQVIKKTNSCMLDPAVKIHYLVNKLRDNDLKQVLMAEKSIYEMLVTSHATSERNQRLLIHEGSVALLTSHWSQTHPYAIKILRLLCETPSSCRAFLSHRFLDDLMRFIHEGNESQAADECLHRIVEHTGDSEIRQLVTRLDMFEHMICAWPFEEIYSRGLPMLDGFLKQQRPETKMRLSRNPQVAKCLANVLDARLTQQSPTKGMLLSSLDAIESLIQEPFSVAEEPHGDIVLQSVIRCAAKVGQEASIVKRCEDVIKLFESVLEPQNARAMVDKFAHSDTATKRRFIVKLQQYCETSSENRLDIVTWNAPKRLISFARVSDSARDQVLVAELLYLLVNDQGAVLPMILRKSVLDDLIELTHRTPPSLCDWVWKCLKRLAAYDSDEVQRGLVESCLLQTLRDLSLRFVDQHESFWFAGCDILMKMIEFSDDATRLRIKRSGGHVFAFQALENEDTEIQQRAITLLRELPETHRKVASKVLLKIQSFTDSPDATTKRVAGEVMKAMQDDTTIQPVVTSGSSGSHATLSEPVDPNKRDGPQAQDGRHQIQVKNRKYFLQISTIDDGRNQLFEAHCAQETYFSRGERVMMKLYPPQKHLQALNEVNILRKLVQFRNDHGEDYVVSCEDFEEQQEFNGEACSVLIMALGKSTLKQMVTHRALSNQDLISTMEKVAKCLHFLHSVAGVVHGAVELENVVNFSDGFPMLKLIHFDGSRSIGEQMTKHCRTEYCPPELARQLLKLEKQSSSSSSLSSSSLSSSTSSESVDGSVAAQSSFDVWCFGVLWMKILLRGQVLFEFQGLDEANMLKKIAKPGFNFEQTLRHLDIPRPMQAVIRQCTRYNPKYRWTSLDILKSHVIRGYNTTIDHALSMQGQLREFEEKVLGMMTKRDKLMVDMERHTLPYTWLLVPWRDTEPTETSWKLPDWLGGNDETYDMELKMICDAALDSEDIHGNEPCSACPEGYRLRIKGASPLVKKALPILRCASALFKIANVSCLIIGLPAFSFVQDLLSNVFGSLDVIQMVQDVLAQPGLDDERFVQLITDSMDNLADLAEAGFEQFAVQQEEMLAKLRSGKEQVLRECETAEKQQVMRDLLRLVDATRRWPDERIVGGLEKMVLNHQVLWVCAHHAQFLRKAASGEQPAASTLPSRQQALTMKPMTRTPLAA